MNGTDESVQIVGGVFVYALAGVTVGLGGWQHWSQRGRALYGCLFPLHLLLGSLIADAWPHVGPQGDRKALWQIGMLLFILLLMIALCGGR